MVIFSSEMSVLVWSSWLALCSLHYMEDRNKKSRRALSGCAPLFFFLIFIFLNFFKFFFIFQYWVKYSVAAVLGWPWLRDRKWPED